MKRCGRLATAWIGVSGEARHTKFYVPVKEHVHGPHLPDDRRGIFSVIRLAHLGVGPSLAAYGKTLLSHVKFIAPEGQSNRTASPQDAQKGCPARPQRMKVRGVPLGYVEGLNDARTKLAGFLGILL